MKKRKKDKEEVEKKKTTGICIFGISKKNTDLICMLLLSLFVTHYHITLSSLSFTLDFVFLI